jgi:hypothetical protein
MIGNSTTGASFKGLSTYLEADGKKEWKEVRNLASDDPAHYTAMMEDTASLSRAEKPVYHLSISYAEGDAPSRAMMQTDAEKVLSQLGLANHQAVMIAHGDTAHRHVHVMVNRVDPATGKAWNPWREHARVEAALGQIERERGYQLVSALGRERGR